MKLTHWTNPSLIATLTLLSSPIAVAQTAPMPTDLQVPDDQQLILTIAATGDQIYTCQAQADQPDRYAWTLKAPEALLYDAQGREVGHHFGGPSWQLNDGSQVVGQLQTKIDAPVDTAIPWLLLQVKSHQGEGQLSQANWIQRVNTIGGKAPVTGCDAQHENQQVRVEYSADYYFYGDR